MSAKEKIYDWKITVIAQYNKSWAPEYKEFIDAIKSQIVHPRLRFIVFTYYQPDSPDGEPTASVIHYFQGMPQTPAPPPKPVDFYDPATLDNFFRDEVAPHASERHLLITWGHGAGLGFFPPAPTHVPLFTEQWFTSIFDPTPVRDKDKQKKALVYDKAIHMVNFIQANYSAPANFVPAKGSYISFRGEDVYQIRDSEKLADLLKVISATQLARALADNQQYADIFIASNCYCQLFESGFAMKDVASIMIAAETTYPISGFNYNPFFGLLATLETPDKKDTVAEKKYLTALSKNITDEFNTKYMQQDYIGPMLLADPTLDPLLGKVGLFANDLSFYKALSPIIDQLGTILSQLIPQNADPNDFHSAIGNARRMCRDLATPSDAIGVIDLINFVSQLKLNLNQLQNHELDNILDQLNQIKKDCNIAALFSDEMFQPFNDTICVGCTLSPNFLAIFCLATEFSDNQEALFQLFYASTVNTARIPTPSWANFIRIFHKEYF